MNRKERKSPVAVLCSALGTVLLILLVALCLPLTLPRVMGYDIYAVITHRVVENNTLMGQFVTKGDANEKADVNPVSYEEFIGKLTLSIPYLGRLAQFFTSTSGKIGAGIVILAALLLHVIGGAVESFQNRKNKKHRDRE